MGRLCDGAVQDFLEGVNALAIAVERVHKMHPRVPLWEVLELFN